MINFTIRKGPDGFRNNYDHSYTKTTYVDYTKLWHVIVYSDPNSNKWNMYVDHRCLTGTCAWEASTKSEIKEGRTVCRSCKKNIPGHVLTFARILVL